MQIKEEFRSIIPPLTKEEYQQLEANCIKEGIRDTIITWNGFIIDGHNRYEIAQKHKLSYITESKEFDNENDVKIWMINNQFGRRNLSNYQRSVLALELEDVFSAKAKDKQKEAGELRQKSAQAPIKTRDELAKVASVSHDTISKVKVIQTKATPEVKEKLSTGELSINQVFQDIRKQEKIIAIEKKKDEYFDKIQKVVSNDNKIDIFTTKNKYRVIYADPAWSYNDKCEGGGVQSGGVEVRHYDTMSTKDICLLPVSNIIENNAVLFLWVTSPLLPDGLQVIKAWGFEYKTSFVWDKIKHNMGHYNSVRHEFLLVATKGSCTPDNNKLYDSVQSIEKSGKHSEKPKEFINIIDDLYTWGDRIELFCRENNNKKWYIWGNEV